MSNDTCLNTELPEQINVIAGQIEAPAASRDHDLCNASTGEAIQSAAASSPEQAERALQSAHDCWQDGSWERTSPAERADLLDTIADQLSTPEIAERIAIADALTTGVIINATRKMSMLAPYAFRGAAQALRDGLLEQRLPGPKGEIEQFRRPWGPALLVSPWNGPTAISAHKVASALAAGAPAILKPSEWAPHSAVFMAQVIAGLDLPAGAFQLVLGDRSVGKILLEDPRIKSVSFTGGLAGGRAVAEACSRDFRPTQLELGGNNPLIVFEDADLDAAAEGIAFGLVNLNAQWCRALGRLLVHASVKDALIERVLARLGEIRIGDALDTNAQMGPMAHARHKQDVETAIAARLALGGRARRNSTLPDGNGFFVAPTLIDGCDPADTEDEIFGPAAAIHTFETDAEALALANGPPFGLAGYVFSADEDRAFAFAREMRTGGVKINGYSLLALNGDAPRPAWALSGLGEEGRIQSIEFFSGTRVVGLSKQDPIGG